MVINRRNCVIHITFITLYSWFYNYFYRTVVAIKKLHYIYNFFYYTSRPKLIILDTYTCFKIGNIETAVPVIYNLFNYCSKINISLWFETIAKKMLYPGQYINGYLLYCVFLPNSQWAEALSVYPWLHILLSIFLLLLFLFCLRIVFSRSLGVWCFSIRLWKLPIFWKACKLPSS